MTNLNDSPPVGRRLTEAELDDMLLDMRQRHARIPRVPNGCHGPCDQGRRACPVPDACQRINDGRVPHAWSTRILLGIGLVLTVGWVVLLLSIGMDAIARLIAN